ncbi:MAG TPA: ice-binding family protein [Candidatus Saccharimonadales bacterium]|nr:ice-binding family protein [Candidatus Saccharimonadales bacterium]
MTQTLRLVLGAALFLQLDLTAGQAPVNLATVGRFAVLAATDITSIPTCAVIGNVGLTPAARSSISGLTAVEVTGTIYAASDGGAVAAMLSEAQSDLGAAFINTSPAVRPNGIDVSIYGGGAGELGGRTLAPGLYQSAQGSYSITSLDLTLDAGGNAGAIWIFQTANTLQILNSRKVILAGGAQAGNIFWQVGTSATLYTYSTFQGTIMAAQSITLQTGATLNGRALAQNGAVTLDANPITDPNVNPGAITFGPTSYASNGSVTLTITNTPGLTLTLQTSTNLTSWSFLATATPSVNPYIYIDNLTSGQTTRFYRAFYP